MEEVCWLESALVITNHVGKLARKHIGLSKFPVCLHLNAWGRFCLHFLLGMGFWTCLSGIRFHGDLGFGLLGDTWTEEPVKDKRRVFQSSLSLAIYSRPGQTAGCGTAGAQNTVHGSSWSLGPTCLWLETSSSDLQKWRVEILAILFMIHSRFVTLEIATGILQSIRRAHFPVCVCVCVFSIKSNQIHLLLDEANCPERPMSCVQVFQKGHCTAWSVWSVSFLLLMVAQGHVGETCLNTRQIVHG